MGGRMKKQHIFTLDIGLIKELHRRVARGHRSQFVETAVKNRLNNEEDYNAGDLGTRQLMALLHTRLESRTDAAALMVREFLVMELL
jgi:hypothetical protein